MEDSKNRMGFCLSWNALNLSNRLMDFLEKIYARFICGIECCSSKVTDSLDEKIVLMKKGSGMKSMIDRLLLL